MTARDLDSLGVARRVEALLAPWQGRAAPGVTLGVVRDGELVLHLSAGLASLELDVPIGPATAFRIASVSKQFTCAAILMLAADGRLAPDDAVRAHVPELPEYGHPLTIDHLMHNTSGLRDMFELSRHGGADLGQPLTRDDFLAAIFRQRDLNFTPGTRYLYSNSSFLLLGLVVERVSGIPLPQFLRERIFEPLGMSMTRMTESPFEVAPGLATGYYRDATEQWRRAPHAVAIGGEGGLVSSVIDLALWARNMETHGVGGAALVAALEEQAPFANGHSNGYARGLQVMEYRGVRTLGHGGSWPGYRTQYLRAPEARLAVIAISNDARHDPFRLAHDVLDVLLDGRAGVHPAPTPLPQATLDRFVGRWLDYDSGYTVDIERDGAGVLTGKTWGTGFRLVPTGDGRLAAANAARDFSARLAEDGASLAVEADAGHRATFRRVAEGAALPDGLAGAYSNADTAAVWTFGVEGEEMVARADGPVVRGRSRMRVIAIAGDFVRVVDPRAIYEAWLDVRVLRDSAGKIVKLHTDGGGRAGWSIRGYPDAAPRPA